MLNKLFYSLLSVVFVSSFQIIALILTSQKATPEQLGVLTMLITVNAFLFLFVDFGLSNFLLHKKSLSQESVKKLKSINITISLAVFIISIIISIVVYLIGESEEVVHAICGTGLNSIALALTRIERAKLQSDHRFKDIFKVDCITRCLGLIFLFLLVQYEYNVIHSYLLSLILINVSALFILNFLIKKQPLKFGEANCSGLKAFCIPQATNSMLNFFTQNMDLFLIAYTAGLKVSGVYGIIKTLAGKPIQVYMPTLMKVYTPLLISEKSTEIIYFQLLIKVSILSSVIYSILAIGGDFLLDTLFNINSDSLYPAIALLCLYFFFRAVCMPVGALIVKSGRASLGLKFSIFQVACLSLIFLVVAPASIFETSILLVLYQISIAFLIWLFIVNQLVSISLFRYCGVILVCACPILGIFFLR